MPSFRARFVNCILPLLGSRKQMSSEERMAKSFSSKPLEAAPPPRHLARNYRIERKTLGNMLSFQMTPKQGANDLHVLYLHGGAYVNELVKAHWLIVEGLAKRTGATIHIPLYPLAPQHTWAEAFPPLRAYALDLLAGTGRVVFAGDSAGGGLALALAQVLRDEDAALPHGLLLFSPWLDIAVNDPLQKDLARKDRMLAAPGLQWAGRQWRGKLPVEDPRVSPIHGSLQGLPPVAIFAGTLDLLYSDALRFMDKARKGNHPVTYHEKPGLFHVWMGAPIPEAQEAFNVASRFLNATLWAGSR